MTEKRFTMDLDGFFYDNHRKKNSANIYDNNTFIGSVMIGAKFIIDLLNELDEKYVDEFALRETLQQELQRSEEENEQLKIRFNEEREKSLKFCRNIDTLTIENEQLKSKNRGLQSELQIFKEDTTHSNLQISKLIDENEQLKKEILWWKYRCGEDISGDIK